MMTALNPNGGPRTWHHHYRTPAIHLYISDQDGRAGGLVGERAAGFPLIVNPCDPSAEIDPANLNGAAAAIVEVAVDVPASVQRFQALAKKSRTPLIAAVYDAPLALVRTLIRSGAHDVIPLPIELAEIEASLAPLRDRITDAPGGRSRPGGLVAVIKGSGGAGATSLLGQLALRHAERSAESGIEACLIDLDVQFGDAAFQLGLRPKLSLEELFQAGKRLDGDLLRATTTNHASGLRVIAAPSEMMPLESVSSDHVLDIVDLATAEFGTVFVDLPSNWTNWSLSIIARADLVLLVTEISVPALRQARRQLDLIQSQGLEDIDIRVVANRCQSGLFKQIRPGDVRGALGRDIAFSVVEDQAVMRAAVDQGVPISAIKRKSAVGRDLDRIETAMAAALGQER